MLQNFSERNRTLALASQCLNQRNAGVFARVFHVKTEIAQGDAATIGIGRERFGIHVADVFAQFHVVFLLDPKFNLKGYFLQYPKGHSP